MRSLLAPLLLFACSGNAATLPEFPPNAIWSRDISNSTVYPNHPNSAAMITATGGWGNGNVFQIDQSMHVMHVSAANEATVPMATVVDGPYGYTSPDCETEAGLKFPLPVGGAIEGSTDYTCDNANEDCHLYVVLDGSRKLYESYQSNRNISGQLESGCVIIWDLNKVYPPQGRGEQCTSADAAGFPMAPLLFNADEVFAAIPNGDLGHAIRFILPNPSMAANVYVHPASHAGGPSGSSNKIPYGSRLRLHGNYNISGYSPAGQAVLRTMKRYGIVLSDGRGRSLDELLVEGEQHRLVGKRFQVWGTLHHQQQDAEARQQEEQPRDRQHQRALALPQALCVGEQAGQAQRHAGHTESLVVSAR